MDWPHSPPHRLGQSGAFIVTAATYRRQPFFRSTRRLSFLCETLLLLARQEGCNLQAWAVFPNHYHFIGECAQSASLPALIRKFHSISAREVNTLDRAPSRKVWFQYCDTHLTFAKSYYARMNYVHQNAVRHRLVTDASAYPWCSAGWFGRSASPAYVRRISGLSMNALNIPDEYVVEVADVV